MLEYKSSQKRLRKLLHINQSNTQTPQDSRSLQSLITGPNVPYTEQIESEMIIFI